MRNAPATEQKKHKRAKVAFIGWNPFHFLHFARIAALFPKAVYIIDGHGGASGCFDFENLPGAPSKVVKHDRAAMEKIDGRFDVLVCLAPFTGIEKIRRSRIAMLQYGYAKEERNFAPWRSFADVCLTFGNHASRKIESFAPCVVVGNPRYEDWDQPAFRQAAAAKYGSRLDARKKTLLYAPTWDEHCSIAGHADALMELSRSHNVIVKVHHQSEAAGEAFMKPLRERFNIVCDSRDDIVALLAVSDLMITDSSGAIFDAVFCKKPVVLLETPAPDTDGTGGLETSLERTRRGLLGTLVATPADLGQAVAESLAMDSSAIRHLEPMRSDLFANPVGAAEAASQVILTLATEARPRKPLHNQVRSEMRKLYQCQAELAIARSFRGFAKMTLDRFRDKLPFRRQEPATPAADDMPPPAKSPKKPKSGIRSKTRSIHIGYDIPAGELRELLNDGDESPSVGFVHVSHGSGASPDTHLLSLARVNPKARTCIVELARAGYYTYMAKDGATRLVRADLIESLWRMIVDGSYQVSADGLIHTVTPPLDGRETKRLLVVMSSVHTEWNQIGLGRYFMQNFPTVQKYMPAETAVLRIADLGGVMGAFYLDTHHRPDHAQAIQNLIRSVRQQCGIDADSVVLYGVSKGATGALYHGLLGGYRFVAVDPLVSDAHYVRYVEDAHFTEGGVFPETKEEAFERLFRQIESDGSDAAIAGRSAVICSERSPQFPFISAALFDRFQDRLSIFNSLNPLIVDHPDVGPRTVNCATMLMNMQLYGMRLPCGIETIG